MQQNETGNPAPQPDSTLSVLQAMNAAEQGVRSCRLVVVATSGALIPHRIWCANLDDGLCLAVPPHSTTSAALLEDKRACLLFDQPVEETISGIVEQVHPDESDDPVLDRLMHGTFAGRLIFRITPIPLAPPETLDDPAERRLLVQHIFSDLPRTVAGVMARRLRYYAYQAGDVVIKQGTQGDQFFIVVDGEVDVVNEGEEGEQMLTTLGPGESFGEAALLLNTPRTATVRARTPLRVLALDKHTFEQVVLLTNQEDEE